MRLCKRSKEPKKKTCKSKHVKLQVFRYHRIPNNQYGIHMPIQIEKINNDSGHLQLQYYTIKRNLFRKVKQHKVLAFL